MRPTVQRAGAIPGEVLLLVCVLLSALEGCASAPKRSAAMNVVPGVEASVSEVRTRVRGLAGRFSGLIEEATDRVMATSPDPDVRRAMLLAKTNAIPALQESLFRPDPLEGLFDAWVLVAQLQARIAASAIPGLATAQSVLTETCGQMETELEGVFSTVAPTADLPAVRGRVHAWAAEHPLADTLASRVSTRALVADTVKPASLSSMQALAALPERLDDTLTRLDTYVRFIPKQARWQAELLVGDLVAGPEVRDALEQQGSFSGSLDRISRVVEQLPGLATSERETLLRAVAAERQATLEGLRKERLETLTFAEGQREAMTRDLAAGREALIDDVRTKVLEDLEKMRGDLVADAADRLEGIVSRAIARGAMVMAALGLGAFVAAFILIRFARRPRV